MTTKTETWLDVPPSIRLAPSVPVLHWRNSDGRWHPAITVQPHEHPGDHPWWRIIERGERVGTTPERMLCVDLGDPQGARYALATLLAGWQLDGNATWTQGTLTEIRWRVLIGAATDADRLAIAKALREATP